jgi:RNA polymerase sigma factor (TIGR02999 family)
MAMNEVTRILNAVEQGDPHAANQLLPLVYDELRRLAAQKLANEKPGQTLDATALVHEAYLRLVAPGHGAPAPPADKESRPWNGQTHFFRAAAEAMRRILVDRARARQSQKRGGAWRQVDLDAAAAADSESSDHLVAVNDALERFAQHDPFKAELVKLRYFAGLTVEETAEVLRISRATADRHWRYAKTWLYWALTRPSKPEDK